MDISTIRNLSDNEKITLIDLIEGMPSDINKIVKITLNEDYMNPSLFKGKERKLHEFSTIRKYLKKDDITNVDNPTASFYQSEYCRVQFLINNSSFDNGIKSRLVQLMDCESYDDETVMKMEMFIAKLLNDVKDYSFAIELAKFINEEIMSYKLKVYDFYTYITVKEPLNITAGSYNHLFHLNCSINQLINNGNSYTDKSDLAVLIYVYFKEIGVEKLIEKYNLLNRFSIAMKDKDGNFCTDVISYFSELENSNFGITEALNNMINSKKYGSLVDMSIYKLLEQNEDMTYQSIDYNGMIYLFKDPSSFQDSIEMITAQLRVLNTETILDYIDDKIDKSFITFDINENDYGHLKSIDKLEIGTAYDSFSVEMKYIALYEGLFYVLFKNRLSHGTIYGLSLNKSGEDRNILQIKESKAYYYKYASNI